jgi:hypothetical protein
MWASSVELAKAIADELVKVLRPQQHKNDAPEPRPSRPEPPAPRKLRQSERPGISMNELARSVPKPKPPRRPSWER